MDMKGPVAGPADPQALLEALSHITNTSAALTWATDLATQVLAAQVTTSTELAEARSQLRAREDVRKDRSDTISGLRQEIAKLRAMLDEKDARFAGLLDYIISHSGDDIERICQELIDGGMASEEQTATARRRFEEQQAAQVAEE